MGVADQVLSYLRILAWPLIAGLAIVLFRGAIRNLMSNVEEVEGFGVRAKIRRQVAQGTMAAEQALDQWPSELIPPGRKGPGRIRFVVFPALKEALSLSVRLTSSPSSPATQPLQVMRSSLSQLDTSITAVLVVFATAGSAETPGGAWTELTPSGIERYLTDLTGVAGWQGVIECRNILRDTLLVVCDHGGKGVKPRDANWFRRVALRALDKWRELVNEVTAAGETAL